MYFDEMPVNVCVCFAFVCVSAFWGRVYSLRVAIGAAAESAAATTTVAAGATKSNASTTTTRGCQQVQLCRNVNISREGERGVSRENLLKEEAQWV